jgi:hypothetical protein
MESLHTFTIKMLRLSFGIKGERHQPKLIFEKRDGKDPFDS